MKKSQYLKTGLGILLLLFVLIGSCSKESEIEEVKQENIDQNQDAEDNQEETDTETETDSKAPSVQILTPNGSGVFNTIDPTLTLSGIAEDNNSVTKIEGILNDQTVLNATGTDDWEISNISLEDGDNSIVVFAYDEANNISSDTIMVTKNRNLTFLGIPNLNPSSVIENTSTSILVAIQIDSNSNLIEDSVELIQVDESGNIIESYGILLDNGNLENGDDIKGDNVFSNYFNFAITNAINLRVRAKTIQDEGEITDYSSPIILNAFASVDSSEFDKISLVHDNATDKINELILTRNLKTTLEETKNWLVKQPDVSSVTLQGTQFEIKYSSGLTSLILINYEDDNGNITRGGVPVMYQSRSKSKNLNERKPKIPIERQTVGRNKYLGAFTNKSNNYTNMIQDKDVLIWDAYFGSEVDDVMEILMQSNFDFNIFRVQKEQCTVKSLMNLKDYGLILFSTHGSEGMLYTKELASEWLYNGSIEDFYTALDLANRDLVRRAKVLTYRAEGQPLKINPEVMAITSDFILELNGPLPNSIVINASCESSKSADFPFAFLSKGAQAYLGFSDIVNSLFCNYIVPEYVQNLVLNEYNAGDAYDYINNKVDPSYYIFGPIVGAESPAKFTFSGNKEAYYSNSLINGDFELNSLAGWNKSGDGRIITILGPLAPLEGSFMSIISTGLGFTTSSGGISQSFKVESQDSFVTLNWNFLSEEFLEYIGSEFQDFLKITITSNDISEVVFEKSIDQIAIDYELVPVSPEIVFDQGDVYMTDWQETIIDLTSYRNSNITLTIEVGDVGDSLFDTAVLLDDIRIE